MAKVAHAISKTRNRNHTPLISQLRTLDRKRPLTLSVPFLEPVLAHEFILTPAGRRLESHQYFRCKFLQRVARPRPLDPDVSQQTACIEDQAVAAAAYH
jgi:hypothetical protein